jgi:two-component system, cell cycle sensor histidine kinase and response regulator CckA
MRLTTRNGTVLSPLPSALAALVVGAAVLTFALDLATGALPVHSLYYLPIVLASVTFGMTGGISAAVVAMGLYLAANPDLLKPRHAEADLIQLVLFLLVGAVASQQVWVTRKQRASEIKYRRLFESAKDGLLTLDGETGEITEVNPFLTELLGYSRQELLGRRLWEIGAFADVMAGTIPFHELQSNECVRCEHLPLETKSGQSVVVEFVSSTILADSKKVIQCNIRDISARTRAESQLALRDAALNAAANAIVITDREGAIEWVNPAFSKLTGYTVAESVGKNPRELVKSGRHEQTFYKDLWDTIRSGQVWRGEIVNLRKDGSLYTQDQVITPVRDAQGEVRHFIGVAQDITARKNAEQVLRTTEERMRFALDGARAGLWDLDYATDVLQGSETFEAHLGRPGTFGRTVDALFECCHPLDREALRERIETANRVGGDFFAEYRILWPDGTVRWLRGVGRVDLGEHGEPVRAVGISLDTTDRHTLEEQYLQAQKMEAIGRLAAGVAHDFNNLLTAILGYAELVRAGLPPDDSRRGDIEEIQKAGTSAMTLTQQLLAFSRKQIIEPTLLDLNLVVSGLRTMLDRLIGEDVNIVLRLSIDPAWVKADSGQMEQVVLNLAVNARDAMPEGGTLTITTALADLDEDYATTHFAVRPGSYSALTVNDTGTGITPEVRARLFEPFFTTKAVGKGTGLGLATVHGIVKQNGGSIGVYSEVGKGTSFTVYLPRVEAVESASPAAPSKPSRLDRAATVLVVEDAEGLLKLTRRMLERAGHTVLAAANADEALQLVEECPTIDLILSDVVMPGTSGPDLARQLVERRPTLKVIYMSGYTEDAIAQHGILKPGIAFLHKPFSAEALGQKVREVLDR